MDELAIERESHQLDIRDIKDLDAAFELADNIVTKNYLSRLEKCSLVDVPAEIANEIVTEHAGIFQIKKIVYDRNENNLQKLINTYATSAGMNSSVVMIVNSNGKEVELYLGTTGANETSSARASANALNNSFSGNFPGSMGELLDSDNVVSLLNNCTRPLYTSVASVSGVGSTRTDEDMANEKFVQGIEKMIDAMQGTPFSAVFIANVIDREQLEDIKAEYEVLYSRLIPFLKSELSFNESSSDGVTKTLSESLSTTLTKSKSSTLSVGTSESNSHTDGGSTTHTDSLSAHIGFRKPGRGIDGGVGYSHSVSRTKSWSDTTTFGTTKSQSNTIGDSEAKGEIQSIADGTSKTETTGRTLSITYMNKSIQQMLDRIDEQLERIKESENYGVFATSAYFFAATPVMAKMAASAYKSLINGNCTHVENAHINSWQEQGEVDTIKQYIKKLRHPVFALDEVNVVTPCSVVSGKELAIQMGIPHSSISGVSVVETAAFGRNVVAESKKGLRSIEIGNLYHMGREEEGANGKIPVRLDLDSLTMHTFITGSTGAGKSNAIYSLLERVLEKSNENSDKEVTFMVIEPAKGEYKDKFGHLRNVKVYGTNAKKMDLLRINPFSFPDEVHVLEHIDRLIEIFNVCWPMYAAMPAVLKDAVERSYVSAGWDLGESECRYHNVNGDALYPSFCDVLRQIDLVMEESKYSSDSKGDYSGALCTRIKSLTNGLYGQIFSAEELSSEELYDSNVIVDLSRVGSVETKSLIMGLLIMKMQEYRMSTHNGNNSGLKHLTVLEEAHNLLKRTSSEQSSDSSNLLGKSVEMLANSIAEMRTYGEGFVIADQAPGLLDMAVIRNTNTKIILRLPDMSDRELVGKAAALNDSQILELSKLQTGVAAIYQNNWLEPVLCHIHPCKGDEVSYQYQVPVKHREGDMENLIDYIMLPAPKKMEIDSDKIRQLEEMVFKLPVIADAKVGILRYIKENNPHTIQQLRSKIIYAVFNSEAALLLSNSEKYNIHSWYNMMLDKLIPSISLFAREEQDKILAIIANEHAEREKDSESVKLREELLRFIGSR